MQKVLDAKGLKLTDALFAEAYRATIPVLADAKHVTVRACSARIAELTAVAADISDVVEVGMSSEKPPKLRAVAVPVTVHVDDGAAIIKDDTFLNSVVSFEINGIPEVQIVNLAVTTAELEAQKKASDAAAQKATAQDQASVNANLEAEKKAAFEAGRLKAINDAKQKVLDEAMKAGEASVANPPAPVPVVAPAVKPVVVPEPPAKP